MRDPQLKVPPRERRERLFFALWPSPDFARQIFNQSTDALRPLHGRRMPVEHLHITLRFMGAVDQATKSCLVEAASTLREADFSLGLARLGFWPKPKVVWLAPDDEPVELLHLARQLETACVACGLPAEKRGYQSHLTLLRKAHQAPAMSRLNPLDWRVTDFALVRSETLPEGAQYTVLQRWPLSGRASTKA